MPPKTAPPARNRLSEARFAQTRKAAVAPLSVIRAMCLECVETWREVELCAAPACPLWRHRFGMMPATAAKAGKQVDPLTYQVTRHDCPECKDRTWCKQRKKRKPEVAPASVEGR